MNMHKILYLLLDVKQPTINQSSDFIKLQGQN